MLKTLPRKLSRSKPSESRQQKP